MDPIWRIVSPDRQRPLGGVGLMLMMGMCASCLSSPALGKTGTILGRVVDANSGVPVRDVAVRACAWGRSEAMSARTEGDGSFAVRDLPPGRYAVCVAAGETFRGMVASSVQVAADESVSLVFKVRQSVAIDGDSWTQAYPTFSQSFVATGLGLTLVRLKAFGPAHPIAVQLLEGEGPGGPINGPARVTAYVGGEGSAHVYWGGGEAACVPGRAYTLRMSAADGAAWVPGLPGRGDVYAAGSAWFDGSARPHSDLGVLICEDDDQYRTSYALVAGPRDHLCTSAGQTFVALSRNITIASAQLGGVGNPASFVRFSIHEQGPGGPQIGPSKTVPPEHDAAVAWGPEEVPVTPGKTYYLHLESFNDGKFLIGYQRDTCADGVAVFDGRLDRERDIAAVMIGEMTEPDFARLVAHRRLESVVYLENPSFEDGETGWSREGTTGAAVGCDAGVMPAWGTGMFGWTHRGKGEGSRTVIYQQVRAVVGRQYAFSGSVFTDHVGGRSSDVKVRLVALPAGGTAVRDLKQLTSSQWYATEGQWRRGSVEFEARAETVTVGFDLEQRWSLDSSSLYVDGAHLEQLGAEQ